MDRITTSPAHTPGPWRVRDNFYIGVEGDPFSLAEVHSCNSAPPTAIGAHKANAHLIAAAPELLAACKTVLDVFEIATALGKGALKKEDIDAIRDAVANAEGSLAA